MRSQVLVEPSALEEGVVRGEEASTPSLCHRWAPGLVETEPGIQNRQRPVTRDRAAVPAFGTVVLEGAVHDVEVEAADVSVCAAIGDGTAVASSPGNIPLRITPWYQFTESATVDLDLYIF